MTALDDMNLAIACAALALSITTAAIAYWVNLKAARTADITAYFYRVDQFAKVRLPDGTTRDAGYHLIIWNRGPAPAQAVSLEMTRPGGESLAIVDVDSDEFPLSRLDSGGRYPIPWVLESKQLHAGRRFTAKLSWRDGNGAHSRELPLRRGQVEL